MKKAMKMKIIETQDRNKKEMWNVKRPGLQIFSKL